MTLTTPSGVNIFVEHTAETVMFDTRHLIEQRLNGGNYSSISRFLTSEYVPPLKDEGLLTVEFSLGIADDWIKHEELVNTLAEGGFGISNIHHLIEIGNLFPCFQLMSPIIALELPSLLGSVFAGYIFGFTNKKKEKIYGANVHSIDGYWKQGCKFVIIREVVSSKIE